MTTRREALKALGAAGASLALAPIGKALAAPGDSSGVASFSLPLRIPPVLAPTSSTSTADYYDMQIRQTTVSILPGKSTTILGYNGMTPGPTIRARVGRPTVVNFYNGLPATTVAGTAGQCVTHLHGGHVPGSEDGFPTDYVAPGTNRTHTYPNNQLPTTLWYHDHCMDVTGPHVWYGLAGFYLLTDATEDALNLPSGAYEIPLVIQDRNFNAAGGLVYTKNMNGETGNAVLVNGVVQPYLNVASRKYRLRVLNGSNARAYRLALSNGAAFRVIGMEGGLLPAPVSVTALTLYPAERADLIVDFTGAAAGTNVTLLNTNVASTNTTYNVMRFRVTDTDDVDPSVVPATLRPLTRLSTAQAVTTRSFTLSGGMMGGAWTINGAQFDENTAIAKPKVNTVEIWSFSNRSMLNHPIHVHQTQFQILDINGAAPPATHAGWKDVVVVPAMGTARIIARFADYTGRFVMHCHILEHEDMAMMARYDVVA